MYSFVSFAFNKFKETLQNLGYFDRDEISKINAKHTPGLKLQSTSEYLQEYAYDSIKSTCFYDEIGVLYKLKYGEIGASIMCKSNPIALFTGSLRFLDDLSGFELTSMGFSQSNINGQVLVLIFWLGFLVTSTPRELVSPSRFILFLSSSFFKLSV